MGMRKLRRIGLVAAMGMLAVSGWSQPLRVLFFSKSSGWEHDVIKRSEDGGMSHTEKVLAKLGTERDMAFSFSKDGSKFSPKCLAGFDVIFFYTSGNLERRGTDGNPPMSAAGKAALLNWIAEGGGFVAVHAGSDCFHTYEAYEGNPPKDKRGNRYRLLGEASDPYIKMLGGEFINHGPQQVAKAKVINPLFPGMHDLGAHIEVMEEWYSLKEFGADNHVLLVMETAGMEGSDYDRPNYPLAWAKSYGEGRVWFNALGHREDVWDARYFQTMLAGGLDWAGGRVDAEIPENLWETAPEADVMPPLRMQ